MAKKLTRTRLTRTSNGTKHSRDRLTAKARAQNLNSAGSTGKTRSSYELCCERLNSRATPSHDAVAGRTRERAEELRARAVVGRVVSPGCFSPSR